MKNVSILFIILLSLTMCEKDQDKTYCWECTQVTMSTTIKCGAVVSNENSQIILTLCDMTESQALEYEKSLTEFIETKSGSSNDVPCTLVRKSVKKETVCVKLR